MRKIIILCMLTVLSSYGFDSFTELNELRGSEILKKGLVCSFEDKLAVSIKAHDWQLGPDHMKKSRPVQLFVEDLIDKKATIYFGHVREITDNEITFEGSNNQEAGFKIIDVDTDEPKLIQGKATLPCTING